MKVGVVGVGSMGMNHARVYSEIAELVGIADINERNGRAVARRFNAEYFKDYHALLDKVDALTIATPTVEHYSIAMDAIANGKHVLIEKPIASSVEEGEKLIDKAKERGVVLAVGHIERHNPVVRYAKKALDNHKFGEPITFVSKRVSSYPSRIRDVGVIHDLGIHDIDVMRYLANSKVESIYAAAGIDVKSEYESHANLLIKFENGIDGFVEVNWLTPMKVRKLYITCSTHYVELDYITQSLKISSSKYKDLDEMDLYRTPLEFNVREISLKKQEPLMNELVDFINAIENGRRPLVDGYDGLMALKIADMALESYKRDEKVNLG